MAPRLMYILWIGLLVSPPVFADLPAHDRTAQVIYGEKHGMSLTMDIFRPRENANGRAIVFVVSGGWHSERQWLDGFLPVPDEFLRRGYTVFAAVHGRQPKFTIPEILDDIHRAVRFVRHHAADYGVDPHKLAIYGASAGGHLSLMQGMAGTDGDPKAADPIDRLSSRVQCVGVFFPPTDFLNYGKEGEQALGEGVLGGFAAAFDFQELSEKTRRFERITDPQKRREIGRAISPISHVSADDPPTLIIHGDKDLLVPYQQGQIMIEKLKNIGVPAKLVTKDGAAHGWDGWQQDVQAIADWFDEHLK
jgi:acetyl esterase/lipase